MEFVDVNTEVKPIKLPMTQNETGSEGGRSGGLHNNVYFSPVGPVPVTMESTVTPPLDPISTYNNDDDDNQDGPHSSFENIIPIENLKHGFEVVNDMIEKTAIKLQEKATEVIQSEQFQNAKKKTTEMVTPAWEKTCEIAAPVWEQTKVTAAIAAEKAQEGLHSAAEKMRPTMQNLTRQLSEASISSWNYFSAVALNAADCANKMAAEFTQSDGQNQEVASENEFNSKPTNV